MREQADRVKLAGAFARAARTYWASVHPILRGELRHWRARAAEIPDPVLRQLALHSHNHKLENLEGAAAFATFVKPDQRAVVVRALVAFQAAYDYADIVSEQPSPTRGSTPSSCTPRCWPRCNPTPPTTITLPTTPTARTAATCASWWTPRATPLGRSRRMPSSRSRPAAAPSASASTRASTTPPTPAKCSPGGGTHGHPPAADCAGGRHAPRAPHRSGCSR